MRYSASEKIEIIRIVEQSHLPARRTLEQLGIPRATFHRWYNRFLTDGVEALEDRSPRPGRVWNRIPEPVRDRIVELALDKPERFCRKLFGNDGEGMKAPWFRGVRHVQGSSFRPVRDPAVCTLVPRLQSQPA
ncbi:hypothetical protein CHELA40_30290 [Chelatococcus asaccharovorans]|nr:hypothetical protein CHELA17_40125 [Chelatococcus asaccharovorans]CAH1688740.1 hypothetical protein CHELA40_30290 [Chelatococcus asaccharovorans]